MRLTGNASHFPISQNQLRYTFELLVGQDFAQVEVYITEEGISWAEVPASITVLEKAFGDPDHVATAE
jgi:hypothetical protein